MDPKKGETEENISEDKAKKCGPFRRDSLET